MKYIRYLCLLNSCVMMSIGAVEVTREQQTVYPQNPHLVQKAGADLNIEQRELFIASMKKASSYTQKISWISGAASLGFLALCFRAVSTKGQIISVAASVFFGAATLFLNKVSGMQATMAGSQELAEISVTPDSIPLTPLIDIADGVYIFSDTTNCPPCKLLHKALPQIRKALPDLTIFEYEAKSSNIEAQALIQRLGITILSIPLSVVVKNGIIVRIIPGYGNLNDYIQKLTESLK